MIFVIVIYSEYLIGKVNLDTSDSGCSSLASRSPSSATSPMHQTKSNDPNLALQGAYQINILPKNIP